MALQSQMNLFLYPSAALQSFFNQMLQNLSRGYAILALRGDTRDRDGRRGALIPIVIGRMARHLCHVVISHSQYSKGVNSWGEV